MAPSASIEGQLEGARGEILKLSRWALDAAVRESRLVEPGAFHERAVLDAPGACFVTLTRKGRLRGCLGTLDACRSLARDICANTFAAALQDPRFLPVEETELDLIRISVSVLGSPEPFPVSSMGALLDQLAPGDDGLIVRYREHRATFLPSVWESLPDPADFVSHLWRKAGLGPGFWEEGLCLWRYRTRSFSEVA